MAIGVLAAFVLALSALWDAIRPQCSEVVLDRLPSPSGAWVAVLNEYTCDVGFFGTDITVGVDLVSTTRPIQTIDLLGVDTGGHADERPRPEWSAPNVLRVTVPNLSFLKVLATQAGEVRVDLRFDPDDPAARAAWLWQLDHPDDPASRAALLGQPAHPPDQLHRPP